jgi:hypothetical protein
MSNDYEYLLFCSMASSLHSACLTHIRGETLTKHQERKSFLEQKGWIALSTSEQFGVSNHGYFGVAYCKLNKTDKTAKVVIAHRGTCFNGIDSRNAPTSIGNLLADIEIADGRAPGILQESVFSYITKLFKSNFYDNTITDQIKLGKYTVTEVMHTGFSLGGFIAGACVALDTSSLGIFKAVTFDAPGIGRLNFRIPKTDAEKRIVNYLTKPNLVNTCNQHIGSKRELVIGFDQIMEQQAEQIEFKVDFSDLGFGASRGSFSELEDQDQEQKRKWLETGMKELRYTTSVHNLDTIIERAAARQRISYKDVYQWPLADFKIIRGSAYKNPDITHFGSDTFLAFLVSGFSVFAQAAKHTIFSLLWEFTKEEHGGIITGVTGIHHSRSNKVYYTEEELIEAQSQAVKQFLETIAPAVISAISKFTQIPEVKQFLGTIVAPAVISAMREGSLVTSTTHAPTAPTTVSASDVGAGGTMIARPLVAAEAVSTPPSPVLFMASESASRRRTLVTCVHQGVSAVGHLSDPQCSSDALISSPSMPPRGGRTIAGYTPPKIDPASLPAAGKPSTAGFQKR